MHDRCSTVAIPFLVAFEPFKFWVIPFQVNSNSLVGLNLKLQITSFQFQFAKLTAHNITTTKNCKQQHLTYGDTAGAVRKKSYIRHYDGTKILA